MPPPEHPPNLPDPPDPSDGDPDFSARAEQLASQISEHLGAQRADPPHIRDLMHLEFLSVRARQWQRWERQDATNQDVCDALREKMCEIVVRARVEDYHQSGKLSVATEHIALISRFVKEITPERGAPYLIGSGILELRNSDMDRLVLFTDIQGRPRWQVWPQDAPIVFEVSDPLRDNRGAFNWCARISAQAFQHDIGLIESGEAQVLHRRRRKAGSILCNEIQRKILALVTTHEHLSWQPDAAAHVICSGSLELIERPSRIRALFQATNDLGVFKAEAKWSMSDSLVAVTATKA
ncbi:hypothetical protein OAO01_06515 [Oligoflexia bacterium]|nr:hypothetical protein [Oligoflexia bacterium]